MDTGFELFTNNTEGRVDEFFIITGTHSIRLSWADANHLAIMIFNKLNNGERSLVVEQSLNSIKQTQAK